MCEQYFKVYGTLVGVYAPAIALGVYVVGAFVLGQKEIYDKKFAFIHERNSPPRP